jgi:hypothetical protein
MEQSPDRVWDELCGKELSYGNAESKIVNKYAGCNTVSPVRTVAIPDSVGRGFHVAYNRRNIEIKAPLGNLVRRGRSRRPAVLWLPETMKQWNNRTMEPSPDRVWHELCGKEATLNQKSSINMRVVTPFRLFARLPFQTRSGGGSMSLITDGILKSKGLPTSSAADEVEGLRSLAAGTMEPWNNGTIAG